MFPLVTSPQFHLVCHHSAEQRSLVASQTFPRRRPVSDGYVSRESDGAEIERRHLAVAQTQKLLLCGIHERLMNNEQPNSDLMQQTQPYDLVLGMFSSHCDNNHTLTEEAL